ncbi:MAG: CHRD domain-containing protein [Saprospiraceae bacterium]|nr:CHRD domain-containing protein [Saprospiraceae bacterium]
MSDGFLDSLRKRQVYTNIHTLGVQAGEVRGQLMPLAVSYFHSTLMGVNATPVVNTTALGGAKLELNGNLLTVSGSFADLVGQFDANVMGGAHIHVGAAGQSTGLVRTLTPTVSPDLQSGFFVAAQNSFTLTNAEVNQLRNENYYLNIHTTLEANGEIRGQILPEINYFPTASQLTAPLSGAMVNVGGLPTQQLMVNWLPSTDPDGNLIVYVVQVATDVDFNNIIYLKEAGESLFTTITYGELDALLVDNGIGFNGSLALYTRIVATDASNATASEAVNVVYTRGPSAANEVLSQQFELSVLPNITSGQAVMLQINASKTSAAQVFLINETGQLLESRSLDIQLGGQTQQFEMNYPAGVYYLSVKTAEGTLPAQQVIIQ